MNRRDRLKKVILAAFDKNKIKSEAVSQCNEAIQYVIKTIEDRQLLKMVAIKVYVEFLVDNLSQIETILRKHEYEGKIVKAIPIDESEVSTTYLTRFDSLLKGRGYEAFFVMATPIANPNACTIVISIMPIYFGDYAIRPDKSCCFRVTMKCKGHQSKMINVKLG